MNTSRSKSVINNKTPVEYLAKISSQTVAYIDTLFKKFEIDSEFQAYQNLITDIPYILRNEAKIFGSLSVYHKTLKQFKKFESSIMNLSPPDRNKNNPVPSSGVRPLAASILMERNKTKKIHDSVKILSAVLVLVIISNKKKTTKDHENIRKAADQIRIVNEQNDPNQQLSNFTSKLKDVKTYQSLCQLIQKEGHENSKLFKEISKIIGLVDPQNKIRLQTASEFTQQSIFKEVKSISISNKKSNKIEPTDTYLLFTVEDDLYKVENNKISPNVQKLVTAHKIKDTIEELINTKKSITRYRATKSPQVYIDKDHLKFKTNLFNIIERHWLTQAIKTPEEYQSNDKAVLITSLSICLNLHHSIILKLKFGEKEDITPDGRYKRFIPSAQNAIQPDKRKIKLYKNHINDNKDQSIVYLPLPDIVKTLIESVINKNTEIVELKDLFVDEETPGNCVNTFIQNLNTVYGPRFNTNRVSCQLKQYIKSIENDPCLIFALFGKQNERPPTAFYYRTITIQHLINTYVKLSNEYFYE